MKFFEVRMFPGLKLTLGFTYTEVTFFVLNPSEQFYRKQLIGSLARADCGVGQGDPAPVFARKFRSSVNVCRMVLRALPGGCALVAIASTPASIIKC